MLVGVPSDEIWYLLQGQETTGPFSKEMFRQMHEGGQFQPDSMVWREGMEGWLPASSVAELDVFAAAAPSPVQPPAEEPDAAAGHKFKLRLKSVSTGSAPASSPSGQPSLAVPSGSAGSAAASVADDDGPKGGPKAFLLQGNEEGAPKKAPMPKWKKILLRIFSSLIFVPLFMIVSGGIVWVFQVQFPNVLWFVWLAAAFGVTGLFSLVGIRFLDKLVRFLAILFLLPPIFLLWPIVTTTGVKTVPVPYWFFTVHCFLYGLTIRMGLRDFLTWGMAGFLCLTGLGVVGFELAVAQSYWTPPGWDRLIEKGSNIRLPATLVRMASLPPSMASVTGTIKFASQQPPSVHPVERAVVKRLEGRDWQLVVQLVDGQVLGASLAIEGGEFDSKKVLKQDWPAIFSKDESQELVSTATQWKMMDGKAVSVGAATLNVVNILGNRWFGTVKFYSSAGKASAKEEPDAGNGEFEMDVDIR